ncbi:hypothetical protein [Aureivirga sp. CE67]|uniref:hypothetical protein n=1 Tax=Aureivirga sp. CE67 TaxID=1788983 RepID=UPI0018CB1743|nr:hypothetical protein [Aureivirga sp. CE67]
MSLLKNIFGNSTEVWDKFADEIGGEFVIEGFWYADSLVYNYKNWEFVLDTYRTQGEHRKTYTRLRVPVENFENFRFDIYDEKITSVIGKWFGMQDIEIGSPKFDDHFIIKGNNPDKVKLLLEDSELRDLLYTLKYFDIKIESASQTIFKSYADHIDVLYFDTQGKISDIKELRILFKIFEKLLDKLKDLNLITSFNPNIEL